MLIFYNKVNGGWGLFGNWEKCPVSCGGAVHRRYRECNNPAPEHGGNNCTHDGSTNVESKRCNENACPSKQIPYNGHKNDADIMKLGSNDIFLT